MYAMYAKRCSSCGLRFVRNYSVGSSTGTKAPAIIDEPINRNRTDRFEIRVCDTNTPLVLAVPAVSTQAAPVNINVGITIKKTR